MLQYNRFHFSEAESGVCGNCGRGFKVNKNSKIVIHGKEIPRVVHFSNTALGIYAVFCNVSCKREFVKSLRNDG